MKLLWIGGITRNEESFIKLAAQYGHELEPHSGHVGGRGSNALRSAVQRADVVVILTDVNSHGAVDVARRTARDLGRPFVLLRKCGTARLRTLFEALTTRESFVQLAQAS